MTKPEAGKKAEQIATFLFTAPSGQTGSVLALLRSMTDEGEWLTNRDWADVVENVKRILET